MSVEDIVADAERLEAENRELRAECERHRRANLVRTVLKGWDETLDGSLTDYINEHGWDAVPWRIAQTHIERPAASKASGWPTAEEAAQAADDARADAVHDD